MVKVYLKISLAAICELSKIWQVGVRETNNELLKELRQNIIKV